MKTNKSFKKRLKVTKSGKVLARKPGQNHFNAKESRAQQLSKRKTQAVSFSKKVTAQFVRAK